MSKQPDEPKSKDVTLHVFVLVGLVALAFFATQTANLSLYTGEQKRSLEQLQTEYRGYQSGVKDGR